MWARWPPVPSVWRVGPAPSRSRIVVFDGAGTEAAAATGMVMRTTAMQLGPVVDFKVDHPFVFVLRETKTGRILFTGRVTDPR